MRENQVQKAPLPQGRMSAVSAAAEAGPSPWGGMCERNLHGTLNQALAMIDGGEPMSRPIGTTLLTVALLMTIVVGAPRPAAAESRPDIAPAVVIFYKYGTMLFETGPLPSPFDKNKELVGFRAGYKCKVFALFFAYFHRWNCTAVAVKGRTNYLDKNKATKQSHRKLIEELNAAIAKKYPPGAMKLNFWEKHGRIVVVLILIGLIVLGILRAKKKKKG